MISLRYACNLRSEGILALNEKQAASNAGRGWDPECGFCGGHALDVSAHIKEGWPYGRSAQIWGKHTTRFGSTAVCELLGVCVRSKSQSEEGWSAPGIAPMHAPFTGQSALGLPSFIDP